MLDQQVARAVIEYTHTVMRERTAYQVDGPHRHINIPLVRLGFVLGSGAWYLQGLARLVFQNVDRNYF